MVAPIDISKKKFGRLTAIKSTSKRQGNNIVWKCKCVCGNFTFVNTSNLRTGKIVSCGCFRREKRRILSTTHGRSHTTEWYIWCGMKRRCYDKNCKDYKRYGGRGIKVCKRWKSSFENFFEDMGKHPSSQHSIDRVDNDGPYCNWNCRGSTRKQQANNRRDNVQKTCSTMVKTRIKL